MILRAEKGYIVIGKDTDGTTMPHDLGITGPRDLRKDEYIGKRSLFLPVANDKGRKQFVGLSVAQGKGAAADRRPCRRRARAGAALAGLRDLELYEPEPRPPDRARPHRERALAHGRDGRRLSSRRGAARDDRARPSRSIRRESGSMREMNWPPARRRGRDADRQAAAGGAGRFRAGLDAGLGRSRAAVDALAPGAPMLGLYALAPEGAMPCASPATGALLGDARPDRRGGRMAGRLVRDHRRRRLDNGRRFGPDAPLALTQGTSADLAGGSPSAAVLVFALRGLWCRDTRVPLPCRNAVARALLDLGSMGCEWGGRARPIARPGLNKRRRALSSLENKPERGQCCNFLAFDRASFAVDGGRSRSRRFVASADCPCFPRPHIAGKPHSAEASEQQNPRRRFGHGAAQEVAGSGGESDARREIIKGKHCSVVG